MGTQKTILQQFAVALCFGAAGTGFCADNDQNADTQLHEMVVRGEKSAVDRNVPAASEGITAKEMTESINVVNTEDALKYMPSLNIRKRYIGDRNAIVATRSSGSLVSARSLVYADGLLLSNLLGNSFNFPPRWSMVSPEEIERIDVIYGPFSAAYPGNSMGGTILMTTRLPDKFESHAKVQHFRENFKLYGTDEIYDGYQVNASLGNRHNGLSWFASFNHLDSKSHPMSFSTASSTTAATGAEKAVTGAFRDTDANGTSRLVFGATGIDHSLQDNLKLKLAYDFSPTLRATYTLGYWHNDSNVTVQTYLRDAAGNPVYSGNLIAGKYYVSMDGKRYELSRTAMQVSKREEEHWMHGLSLKTNTGGEWDYEAVLSHYNLGKDEQRSPTNEFPTAQGGGAGQISLGDGTGWRTLDLKANWRPGLDKGAHEVSFGYHRDRYILDSRVYSTNNWLTSGITTRVSAFTGSTETESLFVQDAWRFAPDWKFTVGGRYERWQAFDGATATGATSVAHNARKEHTFSPKAALSLQATDEWLLRASLGKAYRMPTVSELFQGSITANAIVNNDPHLKPEKALSGDLTAERDLGDGLLRLTLFQEDAHDALYSQTNTSVSPTVTNIQNIEMIRTRGIEAVLEKKNIVRRLDLSGSITYADSEILKNGQYPASIGMRQPRVPDWRIGAVAIWHQDDRLSYTLAGRYSGRQNNTLNNIDINPDTYGGTSTFFIVDTRINYKIDKQYSASVGIDNLNNYKSYVAHPNPQRTYHAEVKFDF